MVSRIVTESVPSKNSETFERQEEVEVVRKPGRRFAQGLDNPESRARAVPLITTYVEPTRFVSADEAEVVRLSGLEAMREQIIECRKSPGNIVFLDKQ